MDKSEFPMRINRYLALKGHATRKDADRLIEAGKVFVNGRQATLGEKVKIDDQVEVLNRTRKNAYVYFAYNKPVGIVTNPEEGHTSVIQVAGLPKTVFPVGRLDKASRGLLLLTNDGRITDRLLNPDYKHDKQYRVTVDKTITDDFLKKMAAGVQIEEYRTKKAETKKIGDKTFSIVLTEGKKHQIRRMCAALGYQVIDLERTRIMNLELGTLREGQARPVTGEELEAFLASLGLMTSSSKS
ncbi:MAG TPA: pseudouridine synthase [Candidatus Paceibacterota bacterium]|nr:pseudouridine synthase [Candidatus Paceibacterota bacterium]